MLAASHDEIGTAKPLLEAKVVPGSLRTNLARPNTTRASREEARTQTCHRVGTLLAKTACRLRAVQSKLGCHRAGTKRGEREKEIGKRGPRDPASHQSNKAMYSTVNSLVGYVGRLVKYIFGNPRYGRDPTAVHPPSGICVGLLVPCWPRLK